MPSDLTKEKQLISVAELSDNRENQACLNPEQIKAGSTVIMTHQERQDFYKNSSLGKLFGVNKWLT
jgi:hypothetical protein